MGTSATSAGPRSATPLIPTWLEDPPTAPLPVQARPVGPPPQSEPPPPPVGRPLAVPANQPPRKDPLPKIEPAAEPNRFLSARRAFGDYVRTGNGESLGRALRRYVQTSSGGGRPASRRMAVPRRTAANILALAQTVQAHGSDNALHMFGLGPLAGRSISEVYPQLIDVLCRSEEGGTIDEAIARDALSEAVAELCEEGLAEGTNLTPEDLNELFIRYVSRTIFDRVVADIGQKAISLPEEVSDVQALEIEVLDTIRGAVRDSLGSRLANLGSIPARQLNATTEEFYELAFDLIAVRGED